MTDEYGHQLSPSTLVPESLTVYRHFGLHLKTGLLTAMGSVSQLSRGGAILEAAAIWAGRSRDLRDTLGPSVAMTLQRGVYLTDASPAPATGLTFEAICWRGGPDYTDRNPRRCLSDGAVEVPNPSCTCGFYAHYDPADDFYPHAGTFFAGDTIATVFAACEVTGKAVMGRRGVRAQKLRVRAVTPDWSKFAPLSGGRGRPDLFVHHHRDDLGRLITIEEWVLKSLNRSARLYGFEVYDERGDLVEDHPRPDLAALGIEVEPPGHWCGIDHVRLRML